MALRRSIAFHIPSPPKTPLGLATLQTTGAVPKISIHRPVEITPFGLPKRGRIVHHDRRLDLVGEPDRRAEGVLGRQLVARHIGGEAATADDSRTRDRTVALIVAGGERQG